MQDTPQSSPKQLDEVTILFAGDSGDGIQLAGTQFTEDTALIGNDLSTFPDFPAEIRAPQGTVAGVSGFQIHFGGIPIYNSGDRADVLVAFNAAAFKKHHSRLRERGILILNTAGFDRRNLKLAQYEATPIDDAIREKYQVIEMDVSRLTKEGLKDFELSSKDKERSKNMFVLGFLLWLYNRNLKYTTDFLTQKFKKNATLAEANIAVLKAGFHYGDTIESIANTFEVPSAKMPEGEYRNISGNKALSLGLVTGAHLAKLPLFFGGYPITPASDILHELSRLPDFDVTTFQAEDEIAGICSAIGASFGGSIGATASSGPGIALKGEALGLVHMLELPLVVINVQRGGPSTGLPTKTEQADLLQAVYGRNGEAPIPVLASKSPSDCFDTAIEAMRYAVEFMTPVFVLSDGYIANGSEPWRFPQVADIDPIVPQRYTGALEDYLPYRRNEDLVRPWVTPGQEGLEHRIGGLEKDKDTGNVSYDGDNHEYMVRIRREKIENIGKRIPQIPSPPSSSRIAVVSWGSTYGSIHTALDTMAEKEQVFHLHLRHVFPFPSNISEVLSSFDTILVPELNHGQLIQLLQQKTTTPCIGIHKIQGVPFEAEELRQHFTQHLSDLVS